ncbi:MAG TPA: peptide chain release factor N(5)-glutamine methyltransferase [Solirubrobacteraceae bacterium]|nr:peptide chain release factor N(5)-glutamine methyltransferase [Solirubrobacteraceae bacterium]
MRSGEGWKPRPSPEAAAAPLSVRDAVIAGAAQLKAAGSATPRLDAELLLGQVLQVGRADLVLGHDQLLAPPDAARYADLLERRSAHEPVAYILGRREFRHLTLAVDRRVLIPRPETELLVEAALGLPSGARVVDVGTGSGAVALALACERPDLTVTATDVSADALAVARANGDRLGLDVRFVQADLLEGVPGPWDAVLANLPYVARSDSLPADVAEFEPPGALFAGDDGLSVLRRLTGMLDGVPFVALEVGEGQARAVSSLLGEFGQVECLRDLAGIERVVVGRR